MRDNKSLVRMPATVVMELLYGVHRMPMGKRRNELDRRVRAAISVAKDDVLAYGTIAAELHAEIRTGQERHGLVTSAEDLQIAAIARANRYAVASRNVEHFKHTGIETVNPWNYK